MLQVKFSRAGVFFGLACLVLSGDNARGEDGVSPGEIVFGQAAVLSGPASALGQGMKLGLDAAFAEINRNGGIQGRKLKLVSADDGYEPERSIAQTRKLIE